MRMRTRSITSAATPLLAKTRTFSRLRLIGAGDSMDLATQNNDLIWDLDAFKQRQQAIDFVMSFENRLCVYSNSVEQLYTNYNLFFPKEENRKLVVLPNPYAQHDTYNGIPEVSFYSTGLIIVLGENY